MLVQFKGPGRNTKCYTFRVGQAEFFISYETVIGVRTSDERVRLDNVWGPTTGRHMNELGIKGFRVVSDDQMQDVIRKAMVQMGTQLIQMGQQEAPASVQ